MAKSKQNESKKVVKSKPKKESYAKQVIKDLKLVKWPTWKEVLKNTIATIVLIVVVVLFFLLLNLILSLIKGWF